MQTTKHQARQSLSKKLLKKSVFVTLLLGLVSSLFFTYQGINDELNREIEGARERINAVAPSTALALYSMDQNQLRTLMKSFEADPMFTFVEVKDLRGNVAHRIDVPHAMSPMSTLMLSLVPDKKTKFQLTLSYEVDAGNQIEMINVGSMEVEVDTLHMLNTAANLLFGITTSTLVSVMLTMVVLMVLCHRQIIKALTQMSEFLTVKDDGNHIGNYPIPDEHEDDEIGALITSFNDVTLQSQAYMDQLKRKTEKLRALSDTDPLTGLWNRRALLAKLTRICRSEYEQKWAVIALGMNELKDFNDKYGHKRGDSLIKLYGQYLTENLPESTFIARASGDAFTMVAPVQSIDDEIFDKLKTLQMFYLPDDHHTLPDEQISSSVGVSIYPEHANKPEALIQCADVALFSAKTHGENDTHFCFYSPELDLKLKHYMQLRKELHKILHDSAFYVVYQPKVCLNNGKVIGAEVLFRLRSNPNRAPFELLEVAEESGQIIRLGQSVIEMTFSQMKPYVRRFPDNFRISVNISPRQFKDEGFIPFLDNISKKTGFPLNRLDIEITETSQMTGSDVLERNRQWMEEKGITVTLDDFGTGFASLEYLLHFGFDQIKIDRQFIKRLPEDDESRSIVTTMVYLAKQFGMTIVAEGIELDSQEVCLRDLGIEYGQGFLYSRGIEMDEFLSLVEFVDIETNDKPAVNE
ncbi:putative bifunctional diguanylate cyclase/phosphodiesterase [Veronia pacifica]|uniref:Diguanylate phosphodiesterase n=1 Tax=Veronia pacifica TaxID=1080227 RepID=A0A1C3EM97_9GAMM|nr:GGDEF domain-containing phosphodiesterase [Veronia pacifica]ODA34345.1 hypothetical protein A8L45_06365 [Veronia pacifica]